MGLKLVILLLTTKSLESPWFPCMKVACNIPLKRSWWTLQLGFRPHFDQRFAQEVMGFQNYKSPNFRNFNTPTWESHEGVPRQNDIWVLTMWPRIENTVRAKVVVSPKSGPWWVLWVRICPWLVHAPKMFQLCINQLVVWFVQVLVNNWPAYHSF